MIILNARERSFRQNVCREIFHIDSLISTNKMFSKKKKKNTNKMEALQKDSLPLYPRKSCQ